MGLALGVMARRGASGTEGPGRLLSLRWGHAEGGGVGVGLWGPGTRWGAGVGRCAEVRVHGRRPPSCHAPCPRHCPTELGSNGHSPHG